MLIECESVMNQADGYVKRGGFYMSCSCSFYRQTGLGIEALINLSGFSKLADLQNLFYKFYGPSTKILSQTSKFAFIKFHDSCPTQLLSFKILAPCVISRGVLVHLLKRALQKCQRNSRNHPIIKSSANC